jgi:Mg-chelatase subunit ChlI
VIAGSELGEHPYTPITPSRSAGPPIRRRPAVEWRHRSERYTEKLATPDTSVADLVGDIDPIKVAEGRSLGDPETIAYGLIPRAHRGIVAVNELPDLAERIQVSMLNVMEERDIQVRGYTLRLPLDVLVVASANPEDYTNRGRIITPLKDRFGAEIRTHYPRELDAEVGVIGRRPPVGEVPGYLMQIIARFARYLRESSSVDQRSGVSARFAIAAAETVAASARHRGAVLGEDEPVARVVDLGTVIDVLRGKLEFESGEEGREQAVLEHLLRRATADTAQRALGGRRRPAGRRGRRRVGGDDGRAGVGQGRAGRAAGPAGDRRHRRTPRRAVGRRRAAASNWRWRRCIWPSDRQDHRRGRNGLWLSRLGPSARHDPASAYTGGPIRSLPVDLREALEQIGRTSWRRVARGPCPSCCAAACRTCAAPTGWPPRSTASPGVVERNNLDGTLQEIKKLLDEAVLAERKELARALDDDARFGEMQIESLSPSPAKAVQELSGLRLASAEARQKYDQIKDLMGREMLDQRFAGMKQALENATDEDRQAVNEMLDDLNDLLDKLRGEDTPTTSRLHGQARPVLPGEPKNVERTAGLAGRAAAAQRFRNSLTPDQRAELDALAQQVRLGS